MFVFYTKKVGKSNLSSSAQPQFLKLRSKPL